MSNVTDIILVHHCGEEEYNQVACLNQYLTTHENGKKLYDVTDYGTNGKVMQHHVWIGAFNYLDRDSFMAEFRSLAWDFPDQVILTICEEESRPQIYAV